MSTEGEKGRPPAFVSQQHINMNESIRSSLKPQAFGSFVCFAFLGKCLGRGGGNRSTCFVDEKENHMRKNTMERTDWMQA